VDDLECVDCAVVVPESVVRSSLLFLVQGGQGQGEELRCVQQT
jgi:hypothetical protein